MKVKDLMEAAQNVPNIDFKAFIALAKSINYRRLEKLENAFEALKSAFQAGEIVNTQFELVKNELNTFVSTYYDQVIAEEFFYAGKYASLPADVYDINSVSEVRNISSFTKKLSKVSAESKSGAAWKAMKKFSDDFSPLSDALDWMKSNKIAASAKKKEAAAAKRDEAESYMKKYVAHSDVKKVLNLLQDLTKKHRDDIFNSQMELLNSMASSVKKLVENAISYEEARKSVSDNQLMSFIFSRMYNRELKVNSDADKQLEKMAQDAADQIVDGFIYKSTNKIAYVIYKKNKMENVRLENVQIRGGILQCDLKVTFTDGSKFTATNSIVQSVSKLGNWFYRYPTTFRDVLMPDGKKMSSPSEQKMEEIFAVS